MNSIAVELQPEETVQPIPWESESLHSSIQNDSSWLISFIDILTILLTVFVLLLAYDEHDPVGISKEEIIVENPQTQPFLPEPVINETIAEVVEEPLPAVPEGELTQLIEGLELNFADNIEISITRENIKLEIEDTILFSPASAELTEAGIQLLDELAATLMSLPYLISVEGHTDNTPIHTDLYPTNWELSAARATIVTRTLIASGVAADKLRAIGYGDTQPLVENNDDASKARNRRVSFVLEFPKEQPDNDKQALVESVP